MVKLQTVILAKAGIHFELKRYFFATRRDTLFCLSKIKYPNKKTPHTTAFGYPALLINKGVCGTRAFSAQTVLDEIPFIDCVARRGARG